MCQQVIREQTGAGGADCLSLNLAAPVWDYRGARMKQPAQLQVAPTRRSASCRCDAFHRPVA